MTAARRWLAHAVLVGVIVLQVLVAVVVHRDVPELEETSVTGSSRERISAMHVLLNRGNVANGLVDGAYARELLSDPDPMIREYAFSNDVTKAIPFEGLAPLEAYLFTDWQGPEDDHWWRSYVFYRRKVGGSPIGSKRRLTLRELDWMLDALRGIGPPPEEVRQHIVDRTLERWEAGHSQD